MPLDANGRAAVARQWMRDLDGSQSVAFTKADLQAAIIAVDEWMDDNASSFNQSLPVGFRTAATTAQKMEILAYVLWRRIARLGG